MKIRRRMSKGIGLCWVVCGDMMTSYLDYACFSKNIKEINKNIEKNNFLIFDFIKINK